MRTLEIRILVGNKSGGLTLVYFDVFIYMIFNSILFLGTKPKCHASIFLSC